MSTSSSPKVVSDRIVRIYEVQLWPDGPTPGEPTEDGPYDVETITLGYPANLVPDEATNDKIEREALRRALKQNGYEGDELTEALASHRLASLKLIRAKFIPAHETFEAGKARNK